VTVKHGIPPHPSGGEGVLRGLQEMIMKKVIALCSIVLVIVGASYLSAQTADEILAKVIEAQGGRDTLEGVEDRTISGTMDMIPMGTSASVTMYYKKPDKMRVEFEMMGMMVTQAYDGQTAWGVNPQTGATQETPEKNAAGFKRQAMGNEALLHPDKIGVTYEYEGKETVKDKECHVLVQTFADGHKTTIYVDAETYLPIKSKSMEVNQMGAEVEAETFYSDYQKVDGISVAHEMSIFQGGQEFMNISIADVEFNAGLEDSLFSMN
jgi:outer membrane lipoprotein-sorting protein